MNASGSLFTCRCAGPTSNVTVDGNGGHSPDCPCNPNTWPDALLICDGCGLMFSEPITPEQALDDFGSLDAANYACERCEP